MLFIILAVAMFCARRPEGLTMHDVTRLLVMAAVPLAMIVKQPDLGTSIIIVLCVGAMMVVAGVPPRFMTFLAVAGSLSIVAATYLDLLKKYQVDRFVAFLNQNSTNPQLPGAQLRGEQRQERDRRRWTPRGRAVPRAPDGARATSPNNAPTSSSPRSASSWASSARS